MSPYENYTPEIPAGDDSGYSLDDGLDRPELPPNGGEPVDSGYHGRSGKKPVREKEPKKKKRPEPKTKNQSLSRPKIPSVNTEPVAAKIKTFFTSQNLTLILGLIMGGLGVWLLVAFLSYFTECVSDQSIVRHAELGQAVGIKNAAGEGGARLTEILINEGFGLGSIVVIVWVIAISSKLLVGWPRYKTVDFTIKCFVALITLSLIIGLATIGFSSPVNWGGYHGRYVNEFIIRFIGWPGAVVLSFVMVGIFVIICMRDLVNWLLKLKRARDERKRHEAEVKAEQDRIEREIEEMRRREEAESGMGPNPYEAPAEDQPDVALSFPETGDTTYTLPDFDEEEPFSYRLQERDSAPEPERTVESVAPSVPTAPAAETDSTASPLQPSEAVTAPEAQALDSAPMAAGEVVEPKAQEQSETSNNSDSSNDSNYSNGSNNSESSKISGNSDQPMVVNVNHVAIADKIQTTMVQTPSDRSMYRFPSIDLLRPGVEKISVDAEEQQENKDRIRKTLLDFDIPIVSIEATVGPTVTLYEIRPDRGVKIAKIRNLADDLAMALSAIGVRIIAPIPGKGTVGIEVANKDPLTVSMQTIIKSKKYQETKKLLPTAIGLTISNDVYIADLAKMPHLLVAGATGQGKSVGLNAIITSLLYSKAPYELKFVMIDPKMVEFSLYAQIEKHYLAKIPDAEDAIITDMSKVVATLNSLCVEMDDRYQMLKKAQVRNLEEYNTKIGRGELDPSEGHKFLPYIVVIVDEFADLIVTAGKEVETPIARLAQKARAVGMHVIIATQRPSVNVITGVIKSNFPARIAFRVSSGTDSKTILDTPGAQQLIGRGDMLISNNSEMVRVQCAFIDTPEVQAICQHIASQPGWDGPYILPEPPVGGDGDDGGGAGGTFFGERDPLLDEVARWIVQSNVASTSGVQRRYSIGYNRAGKIMDQLESLGVVGPASGGKPRDVLVDAVLLEQILNS